MIVAKKDIAEFRKNKYIMMTLLIMPIIISVVLPFVYVLPINQLSRQNSAEVDLDITVLTQYTGVTLSNMTLSNAKLDNVKLENCVLYSCVVSNSTAARSVFTGCNITKIALKDSLVYSSRLYNIGDAGGNTIKNSEYVGGNEELEDLKNIMFNVLLILLIMIPVMIPTVTASYSFVGEKMNKSLEPLLATPITDFELLVGKSGSIFVVSMAATWLSFAISATIVDLLTEPVLGYYPLPNQYWIVGIILLAPGMCLMSILTNVLISSKVNDVRVSQQIGGVLVLPILMFFIFSLTGFLSRGLAPILLFSLVIFAIDGGILWLSLKTFRREEILVSWK
ncbi:MAG TPA: ABC transporter permease subunit [Thermoplasmata archaeon]|nr:ABC transporter permease subunit [Thermoplasmata archaeon]